MEAWSEIEQASYSHSIEGYEEAKQHYEKAAELRDKLRKLRSSNKSDSQSFPDN